MIIRSLARRRPNATLQCLASAPAKCRATTPISTSFARRLHDAPTLQNHVELEKNGVPGLFTPEAFDIAYTQYQRHILKELNASTAGSPWQDRETQALVIEFARDPMRAYLFNLASMAFNNHFFFKGINSDPNVTSSPSSDLVAEINRHFTSLSTLRATFLATAEAMFGPGFVWLVQLDDTNARPFRILTTYLAGSPLSAAHYRQQSQDLNTHNPDSYPAVNPVGAFGAAAKQPPKPAKPLGGIDVIPLLCVNTWEHAWLHDYGVGGKRRYLAAWWDKINWDLVRDGAKLSPRSQRGEFRY